MHIIKVRPKNIYLIKNLRKEDKEKKPNPLVV